MAAAHEDGASAPDHAVVVSVSTLCPQDPDTSRQRSLADELPPTAAERPAPCDREATDHDQRLLETFLDSRCRSRGPVVAISERTMITNQSASEILQPPDRRLLWQWALGVIRDGRGGVAQLVLASGLSVTARCKPVGDDPQRSGIVVKMSIGRSTRIGAARGAATLPQLPPGSYLDPTLVTGWIELTDSERTIAELVAQGLTNKEAGREVFMSHHTVDCHLRQVFRKLGVNSRVALARLVGEHYETLATQAAPSPL